MSECILVADDDREIVKAIAILLEREGYKVLRAYDGLEALDLLAQNQVQLIFDGCHDAAYGRPVRHYEDQGEKKYTDYRTECQK